MMIPASVTSILSGRLRSHCVGKKLGNLKLHYEHVGGAVPYSLVDCFDQSIRKSGRVLMLANNALKLLLSDGTMVTQPWSKKTIGFVSDLPDGAVKAALSGLSPLRRLLIIGQGTVSQCTVIVVDEDDKTHVRAYFKTFKAHGNREKVAVATVHALRGYDKAFKALVTRIDRLCDGDVQDIAHLYNRLIPAYHCYDPKPPIEIARDETAFHAANDIIRTYMAIARLNEPGIIADYDSEFLHDYRVSLRKLRSVVSLFKGVYSDHQTSELKQIFSDYMDPTGLLRDLDVYLLERQHYFDLLPKTLHDGLIIMFGLFKKERNIQHRVMAKYFKGSAYHDSMAQLADLFARPDALEKGVNADNLAYDYACELIWKRYRKVCKIARAIGHETDDEDVHALRIHCKKLRYLMEFFSPLFPEKTFKELIKPLKILLDNLGLFNDYSVQQASIKAFLDAHKFKSPEQGQILAKTVGALMAILYQRQCAERAKVVHNFVNFDSDTIQLKFRKLFQHTGK